MKVRTKLYDLIKDLLQKYPQLRDSDKLLVWNIWGIEGFLGEGLITKSNYLEGTSSESITRCRRKIQENFPELRSSKEVQAVKNDKQDEKGTFIYREKVQVQPQFDLNDRRNIFRD